MAGNDLELKIRIKAELDQVRQALDALNVDLDGTGKGASTAGKGFDGLQKEIDDTASKAKKTTGALDGLQKELTDTGRTGRRSGTELADGFSRIEGLVGKATAAVSGFLSVYAAVGAIKGIADITDQYAQYNAQLKLATDSEEELATAQREVFRIAQDTKAPVADVASTYATLERATKKLGKSQAEILNVLETVNKSIALTPVSAETAKDTLVQFGQALGGDFKNGAQELNSILEQTPGLAQAIAAGLRVDVSELKKMGEEGRLSAELIFNALGAVSLSVDEQFKVLPSTVGGALTQLRNDLVQTFGSMDVTPLTGAVEDLRKTLTDPAVAQGLATLAAGLMNIVGAAARVASAIANFAKSIGEDLASKINGPALDDMERMKERIDDLGGALDRLEQGDALSRWLNANRIKEYRAELDKLSAAYAAQAKVQEAAASSGKATTDAQRQAQAEKAAADAKAAEAEAERRRQEAETAKETERRQKAIDSTIASLAEQAATYGKSAEETVKYQLAVKGASEEEQKRAGELAKQVDALKKAEEAERKAAQASTQRASEAKRLSEERARAERKLAEELEDINIRVLQLSGQSLKARAQALSNQYDPIIAQLKEKGDAAGVALVEKLINLELAKTRLDDLKQKVSDTLKELQDSEQSVDARVTTGEISQDQGAQELQAVRGQSTEELRQYRAELQELAGKDAPGAADALAKVDEQIAKIGQQSASGTALAIRDLRAQLNETERTLASDAANSAVDNLADSFMAMADGSKDAKDAIKDFARGFAQSMAQVAARALAAYAVLQILNAIPGGAAVATAMDMGARVKHTGGIVGRGGTVRQVPAIAFANAPRYHAGGVAGLKPGEVPAILQTGEEVLARNDPRNAANGGGKQQGGGVRILNVVDPSLVSEYMSSSAGEEVIVNAISRNAGAIKQVLI